MHILEKEIIQIFNQRVLNLKTNNFIFTGINDLKIVENIPDRCSISIPESGVDIDYAQNIKIDFNELYVKDILSYTLEALKKAAFLDYVFDWTLNFNNKFDVLKFQKVLCDYRIIVQLIFYNIDKLSLEDQMLLNEIYYFNSIFFNANSFIKDDNLQTYFLNNKRVLDDRENYIKIKKYKEKDTKIN